jgi:hypothetical protein
MQAIVMKERQPRANGKKTEKAGWIWDQNIKKCKTKHKQRRFDSI